MQIEISLAEDDGDYFEHEGYYDSYDEAIEALMILKYGNPEIVNKYIDAIIHCE